MVKHHNDNRPLLREFLEDGLGCCRGLKHSLPFILVFWLVIGLIIWKWGV